MPPRTVTAIHGTRPRWHGTASVAVLAALACIGPAQAAPASKGSAASRSTGTASNGLDLSLPDDTADLLHGITSGLNGVYDQYLSTKDDVQTNLSIQYALQASVTSQWATPHGGPAVIGITYSPWLTWTPFAATAAGSGVLTFSFLQDQFWTHANTSTQQGRLGVLAPPNDWGANSYQYSQITYTQTFPGNWLAATLGQYSFAQYDSNQYAGNAQTNFLNYALSQNGTQTYANAGMGGYVQVNPTAALQFAGGVQAASNIAGYSITTNGLFGGKIAKFAAAQWTPSFISGGTYSLLYYDQPAVPQQPSVSHGVSLSAVQNLTATYALFLRANTASGNAVPIEDSLALGAIVNNPFGRNRLDQAGLGFTFNKANTAALYIPARRPEWVAEAYYNFTVFKAMQLTPDIQTYLNPAFAHTANWATVVSLRATFRL